MTNDEIIRRLLKFVRYKEGILQVRIEPNQWIELSYWKVEQNKFSVYRLGSADWAAQLVKLQDYLYRTFYLIGRTDLSPVADNTPPPNLPIPDLPALNRPKPNNKAFQSPTPSDPLMDGSRIVEQDTTRFSVPPGQYVSISDDVGDNAMYEFSDWIPRTNEVNKKVSDGRLWTDSIQRGFDTEDQLIRFYFNPFPVLAQAVAFQLILQLDAFKIAFQLKYFDPNLRVALTNCDQIVLYVPQRQFTVVAWLVFRMYSQYEPYFRSRLPLFVYPLLPLRGIGFTEEPIADESFGESRCGFIAYAIIKWAAGLSTKVSADPPEDQVIFDIKSQRNNEDLARFHLNPGSFYPYDLNIVNATPAHFPPIPTSPWLKGAIAIANFLAQEVAWTSPGKCTWMGARVVKSNPVYGPVSNEWEEGYLGSLLFLQALTKYIDDPLYHYILTGTLPTTNLRSELAKTDSAIREGLLTIYEYTPGSSHPFTERFYDKPDSRELEPAYYQRPVEKSSDLLLIRNTEQIFKGPSRGKRIYLSLLCAIKKRNETSAPVPGEFREILRDIYINSSAYTTNEDGWNDYFPGMNGLALVGFSYLVAHDPSFPPIPLGQLSTECE